MSVQELRFAIENENADVVVKFIGDVLMFKHSDGDGYFAFGRDEARLLMLFLQEHLNEASKAQTNSG